MNKFHIGDQVKIIHSGIKSEIISIIDEDIDNCGCSNACYKLNNGGFYTVHDIKLYSFDEIEPIMLITYDNNGIIQLTSKINEIIHKINN